MECQSCKDKFDPKQVPKLNTWSLCPHCREYWAWRSEARAKDDLHPPPEGIVTLAELVAHYDCPEDKYW